MKKLVTFTLSAIFAFGFDFNPDFNAGAVKNIKDLGAPSQKITIKLENDNALTGADYDSKSGKFAVSSNDNEFYILDSDFKPLRYGKHDRHFIMEMEDTVGATWYKNEVSIISYNKTFVSYEPVDISDKDEQNSQWRHLISGYDKWKLNDFGNKNRFFTLRAKQQFILDFDYDEASNKFLTASVPNDVRANWSVGVFDGDDKMILEEFVPSFGANLQIKDNRKIDDYYITGIEFSGDFAYLLSKNYSSILKLNLATKQIDEVFGFSGVLNPRAITIKDNKFYIFSREGKQNLVFVFEK